MFGLFGGKKKEAAPVKAAAVKAEAAPVAKAEAPKVVVAPVVEKVVAKPAAAPVLVIVPGAEQVKLRLKLAAAKRSGQTAAAYAAAKGLADIQAKAGRRLGARLWAEEADRILARDPEAA